jgi:uncharacterized membrane protein
LSWYHPSTIFDKIFEGGIVLKGISGLLEFTGGLLLIFIPPDAIYHFITLITQRELLEDPNDIVANTLLHATQHFGSDGRIFLISYLWIHAAVKLIAVIGILKNKLWAYPFSLISLGVLTLYQFYSIYLHGSIGMIALTIFDIFIIGLIAREYRKVK